MLNVSSTQMELFADRQLDEFARELGERARTRHPEACSALSEETLISRMKTEIRTARAFGLRKRGELKRFVDLSLSLGFGFAEDLVWARTVFETNERSPQARLREVEESAVFVVRGL
jgi:hypothetical protein